MRLTKRHFVSGSLTLGSLLACRSSARLALASQIEDMEGNRPDALNAEQPLPELLPRSDLPVCELNVDASRSAQKIILRKGRSLNKMQRGCIVKVPAGVEIPIKDWTIQIRRNYGYRNGARIIFEGPAEGLRPKFFSTGNNGLIQVMNQARITLGIELENLHLVSGLAAEAVSIPNSRFLRLTNVLIEGGKNGLFFATYPTVAVIENSEIRYSGRGGGLTHCLYAGYIEKMIVRNSKFHSPKAEGHAFKCYAAHMDIRDSLFANYLETEDLNRGFYGKFAPVDLGAWSQSILMGNTIIRRGPSRKTALEYRNRQYRKGYSGFIPPNWGTEVVDYKLVDNLDIANPYLFRHILAQNRFINGVLPDGARDPEILKKPGIAIRNNGTAPFASNGKTEEEFSERPSDWRSQNERAVVWALNNAFEGIPFAKQFDAAPFDWPDGEAPIRDVSELPQELKTLLNQ